MIKGRRSYSYTDSYGFLSHLSFLYPPFLCLRLTSALLGWRVAVSVAVNVAVSPHWLAPCRQMRHRCRQRCRQPSVFIGWRVAVRCVPVAVSVAVSVHWLARCRQMHHRCRQRCRQRSLAGALQSDVSRCRQYCRQRSLAGALPSDALPLPSALPSALIGWRVAVSILSRITTLPLEMKFKRLRYSHAFAPPPFCPPSWNL